MHKLIIIEGLWSSGKSTLMKYFCNHDKYNSIEEPNHIINGIYTDITNWYIVQHSKRLSMAIEMLCNNEFVVMERSELASFSYHYGVTEKYLEKSIIKFFNRLINIDFHIIYLYDDECANKSMHSIYQQHLPQDCEINSFIERYNHFFSTYIPSLSNSITSINVSNDNKTKFSAEQLYNLIQIEWNKSK